MVYYLLRNTHCLQKQALSALLTRLHGVMLQALAGGESTSDDEDDHRPAGPTYLEEQELYKRSFLQVITAQKVPLLLCSPVGISRKI